VRVNIKQVQGVGVWKVGGYEGWTKGWPTRSKPRTRARPLRWATGTEKGRGVGAAHQIGGRGGAGLGLVGHGPRAGLPHQQNREEQGARKQQQNVDGRDRVRVAARRPTVREWKDLRTRNKERERNA
jgi:hypothetical protein